MVGSVAYAGEHEKDYSEYKEFYPDFIKNYDRTVISDRGDDFWDSSDDILRELTDTEMHEKFLSWCKESAGEGAILKPDCVEIILDIKLKPIHDKLDYLIAENERTSDIKYKQDPEPVLSVEDVDDFEDWLEEQYP